MDTPPTVCGVTTAGVEDVDISLFVDSVLVVVEMSEEANAVCSSEVSGVDVSPTVEDVVSVEVENADIALVVDPVVVVGMSDETNGVWPVEVRGVDV